jgi:hypothetical protein
VMVGDFVATVTVEHLAPESSLPNCWRPPQASVN